MAKKRKTSKRSRTASPMAQAKRALSEATNAKKTVKQRVSAMAQTPLAVCAKDKDLQAVLKVLLDQAEPSAVRIAALQALQAASFSVVEFESCRRDFIAALRKLADDPHQGLRQRALCVLAREKDGFAQKRLLDGLQDPDKALVPPEKALQLLSYDVHADAYPIARKIAEKPPSTAAKREALRLLAADAKSASIFRKIFRDKKEAPELRQISAAALQAVNPDQLQKDARKMLLDESEKDDMQSLCLTALTQFGDAAKVVKDKALIKRVDRLKAKSSRAVKRSAGQFLKKYGQ